jgi:hypothetical protein
MILSKLIKGDIHNVEQSLNPVPFRVIYINVYTQLAFGELN